MSLMRSTRPCLEGARDSSFSNIVTDPRRPSTLYGAAPDGVYKSTDGGQTWTLSSSGIPPQRVVTNLVVAPNGTLWAGTAAGLFRSTDGARTWRRYSPLLVDPRDPGRIYLGTARGLYRLDGADKP